MKEKLKAHIHTLFADAERRSPGNSRLAELKEELLQNTLEKYEHLLSVGKTPEAAYAASVSGIGDISGLLEDVIGRAAASEAEAVAVASHNDGNGADGERSDDPFGDPSKDAKDDEADGDDDEEDDDDENEDGKDGRPPRSRWYGLVSGIIWTAVLCAYFSVSFATHAWNVTWLLFIMGIAADNVAKGIFDLRR